MSTLVIKIQGDIADYEKALDAAAEETEALNAKLESTAKGAAVAFALLTAEAVAAVVARHELGTVLFDRDDDRVMAAPVNGFNRVAGLGQDGFDAPCLDLAVAVAETEFVKGFLPFPIVFASAAMTFRNRHFNLLSFGFPQHAEIKSRADKPHAHGQHGPTLLRRLARAGH